MTAELKDLYIPNTKSEEITVTIPSGTQYVKYGHNFIDTDRYCYVCEVMKAVSDTDVDLSVNVQPYINSGLVAISRAGETTSKAINVTFRIVKYKIS